MDKPLVINRRHLVGVAPATVAALNRRSRTEGMMRRNGSVSELGARVVAKYLPTRVSLSSGPSTST